MKMKIMAAMLGLCFVATEAQSQGLFGVSVGYGMPESNPSTNGGLNFGLSAEYKVDPAFGVGAYLSYQMFAIEGSPDGVSAYAIPFGVYGNWYAMGGPGFFLGAHLGMNRSTASDENSDTSVSSTDFAAGGQVGFDFPLNDMMTLGAEGRYTMIFADESTYALTFVGQFKFAF